MKRNKKSSRSWFCGEYILNTVFQMSVIKLNYTKIGNRVVYSMSTSRDDVFAPTPSPRKPPVWCLSMNSVFEFVCTVKHVCRDDIFFYGMKWHRKAASPGSPGRRGSKSNLQSFKLDKPRRLSEFQVAYHEGVRRLDLTSFDREP